MRQVITIEICGKELEAEAVFKFTPEVPAYIDGLPEDCYPAEPEEWELCKLSLKDEDGDFLVDVDELILYIEDELIELLRDALEE